MKISFDKPTKHKFHSDEMLMTLLDMLVEQDGLMSVALSELKTELDYHRRLQGVYNILFALTVGVLVVMVIVL